MDPAKKEIVEYLMAQGVLVKPDFLKTLEDPQIRASVMGMVQRKVPASAILTTGASPSVAAAAAALPPASPISVLFSYAKETRSWKTEDFTGYFVSRFKTMEKMLQVRQELSNATSISRLQGKHERDQVAIIGMIHDKQLTKNENIMMEVEDRSGRIKVLISKSNSIYTQAMDLVVDETIGITGQLGKGIIFADNFFIPDIPLGREKKKCAEDVYALVLSDLHVGSALFMEKEFENFLRWINGQSDDPISRDIAKKVKYIFMVGDLVDGVGIYPSQDKELSITDIYGQYESAAKYLARIPSHLPIIMCPGNHDALRLSEPQPVLPQDIAKAVYSLPNIIHISSPGRVLVHKTKDFGGFEFLLYHGYSYDHYGETVESIRNSGRHISDRVELIMKFLLQRRHLAPSHGSTLYIPDAEHDNLIIESIPDFFLSGHIHRSCVGEYRGVTVLAGSCFQAKTDFQERVGHEPNPGFFPLINLQTRDITMLDFNDKKPPEQAPAPAEAHA